MKRGLPSPAFIYKCSGERWKISYWQEVVVAQKWTTLDGNQSFEFAALGQHFLCGVSFQLAQISCRQTSHITLFHFAWSLQCFIASRKSHHSVYILVFLLNPLPLLDAKVAKDLLKGIHFFHHQDFWEISGFGKLTAGFPHMPDWTEKIIRKLCWAFWHSSKY